MNEKEKRIKDQRTIEAVRKGIMGLGGKFGLIIKNMGQPILGQSGGALDTSYLDDPWALPGENDTPWELKDGNAEEIQNQIPRFDLENNEEPIGGDWRQERDYQGEPYGTHKIGMIFDGLSRGIHMEIKYMFDSNELTVYYKGYLVYQEIAGDLTSYVPDIEWESQIDTLYAKAKKREQISNVEAKEEKKEMVEKVKQSWWREIQKKWGL
jgi:hypothetical protein